MRILPPLLTAGFLVFWTLFVFIDYWQKHPSYYYSFVHFHYWGLALGLFCIGAGAVWLVLKRGQSKLPKTPPNGLLVGLLFLLVGVLSVGAAHGAMVPETSFGLVAAARVAGHLCGTALAVLLVVCASYVLGSYLNDWMKIKLTGLEATLAAIAAGMMGLVLFSFLLGAVSLLHSFVLYPCVALLLVLGRKKVLAFLRSVFWAPLATNGQLGWVGVGSFYLLTVVFSLNFTAVNVPMPAGFDSLTVYANLPALIGERHSLVEGFQPYNWSVLMALGHVLFGSTAVSLALSYLGGMLAAFAMFALCRNWLRLDANYSMLAVLLFCLTPSITVQSSAELKIDLGLLFVTLTILLVLLNYLKRASGQTVGAPPAKAGGSGPGFFAQIFQSSPEVAWMGLLSGFALGIKLTTLYFAFALLAAVWYAHHGRRGFWAVLLACLSLVFLLRLDDFGGLRQFHLGVGLLQWGLALAALLLLAGAFLANRPQFQKSARHSLIYGAFAVATFLPWAVKNFAETRSFSPAVLMNGKAASPDISLPILENNLQKNGNQGTGK